MGDILKFEKEPDNKDSSINLEELTVSFYDELKERLDKDDSVTLQVITSSEPDEKTILHNVNGEYIGKSYKISNILIESALECYKDSLNEYLNNEVEIEVY